jgi:hypothetical protein
MNRWYLKVLLISVSVALLAGCANRVSFISRGRDMGEQRWKVEKLKHSKLSRDQQALISDKGKPDYIKFYNPMRKRSSGLLGRIFNYIGKGIRSALIDSWRPLDARRNIEAWVYEKEGAIVWFKRGRRVDYAAVEE